MQKITVVNVFAIYSKSNIQNFYILVHFVCRRLKIDISFYIAVRAKFKFFRGLLDFPKKRHILPDFKLIQIAGVMLKSIRLIEDR